MFFLASIYIKNEFYLLLRNLINFEIFFLIKLFWSNFAFEFRIKFFVIRKKIFVIVSV